MLRVIASVNSLITALYSATLFVNLDSQLVILQLNGYYSVRNPHILRFYLRVCLLERNFDYITYQHIPRRMNALTDTVANIVL